MTPAERALLIALTKFTRAQGGLITSGKLSFADINVAVALLEDEDRTREQAKSKFCVDCRHYQLDEPRSLWASADPQSPHPDVMTAPIPRCMREIIDLVTGKNRALDLPCTTERMIGPGASKHPCGPEAKYFEAKSKE